MGKVQRQGLGEDKEYVAHKMTSTYINNVKWGGGATVSLAPPIPMPLLVQVHSCLFHHIVMGDCSVV